MLYITTKKIGDRFGQQYRDVIIAYSYCTCNNKKFVYTPFMELDQSLNNFIGNIIQKPPIVSAVKINGKRAYKLLRNNENFETKKKLVKIYAIKLIDQTYPNISKFKIICGKGFYIRSFARDLGEMFNTKAHIYTLKRT